MANYKLPELPSDDELGITKEDRELADEGPYEGELTGEELLALLEDTPGGAKGGAKDSKAKKKDKKKKEKGAKEPAAPESAPAVAEGPRSRWRGVLTAVALLAMAVVGSSRMAVPRPVPANAADTAFSSARAMSMLVEVARRPHPTGSPEHARVREYVVDRLRSLGLEPEVHTTTSVIQRGAAARVATVRNVMARVPGTRSSGAILITAHYDSRELSPGAGDDGSGVVAILEAVRALRAGAPVRNDVIVLITDAEELGLLGARAFVDEHPWLADVSVVLSFEMRGAGGPSIMFETNDQNGWIVRALAEFDPRPFANSMAYEVYQRLPNDTDFTPFKEAGKQGLNFAAIGRGHVYHQATDTPENLSEGTLQHHGLRALAALRYLGEADLAVVDAPNLVYFSVPLLGLVVYDPTWVQPITGGLVAAFALLLLFALRRGARVAGVVVGVGVAILGGALAYGIGVGLLRWTSVRHPEAGSLNGSFYHSEGWYVLGLAAAVLVVVTTLHGASRRWLRPHELTAGALLPPLALAAWLGFAAPLGAMNVQWPVAAALLSGLAVVLLGSRGRGPLGWIATLLFALPVLVLLVPVIELLWITLSVQQAPLLGVLMAMAAYLSLPALESLRHPNAWWAPLAGLVVAGGALGLGTLAARPSASRPAPSTLIYAYEHGTAAAVWVADRAADPAVDSVALVWASGGTGSSFGATRDLIDFGLEGGERPVGDAPVFAPPPPYVALLSDTTEGMTRRMAVGVRSNVGAELMRFQLDTLGGTRVIAVNGRALTGPGSLAWVEHWGQPDSLVLLDLALPASEPLELHIVEHLLRPQEIPGLDGVFRRPPELAPDVSAASDRAIFRSSLPALLDALPAHTLPGIAPPAP